MTQPADIVPATQVPWAPIPSETPEEYAAFMLFLYSGDRSDKAFGHPLAIVRKWAHRTSAYDRAMAGLPLGQLTKSASRDRALATLAVLSELLRTELLKHFSYSLGTTAPTTDLVSLSRILKMAVQSERLLRAEQKDEQESDGPDLSLLSEDDIHQLDLLVGKAERR